MGRWSRRCRSPDRLRGFCGLESRGSGRPNTLDEFTLALAY